MKSKGQYIFILFLLGIFTCSFTQVKVAKPFASPHPVLTINSSGQNSGQKPTGDSPFIRFHSGISESGVSVASNCQSIIPLKPVNSIPEKFAGIISYLSSLDIRLPVTREIFYSTPLRSPPIFS